MRRAASLVIGVALVVMFSAASCEPESPPSSTPPPSATRWVQPGNEDVCVLTGDGRWIEEDDGEDCTPDESEIHVKAPRRAPAAVRTAPRATPRTAPRFTPRPMPHRAPAAPTRKAGS